jgi:hypothetical protein
MYFDHIQAPVRYCILDVVQSFDLLRKASSGQELRHSLATTTLGNCSHSLRTIQYARRASVILCGLCVRVGSRPKCKSLSSIWSVPEIQSLSNIRSRPKMQIPLQHPKSTQFQSLSLSLSFTTTSCAFLIGTFQIQRHPWDVIYVNLTRFMSGRDTMRTPQ